MMHGKDMMSSEINTHLSICKYMRQ